MRVFKCDRCGKHYEGIGIDTRRSSKRLTLSVPDSRFNMDEEYFDLCDTCFIELKEWLGVRDEEESEDGSISN